MTKSNLLFIMSDEHNKYVTGAYGNNIVKTPNLDALSTRGIKFTKAYTNCPICVPARATIATGLYPHEIKCWDNSFAFTGNYKSWGHIARENGVKVTTIGKLHYRSAVDDVGFDDQRIPMHIKQRKGDLYSLIREEMQPRIRAVKKISDAGPGETQYTRYDEGISELARRWLTEEAQLYDQPWALFVSFITPHFPLKAPDSFYKLYSDEDMPLPIAYKKNERSDHPVIKEMMKAFAITEELDEPTVRKAIHAYYSLVSFMDHQVGKVVNSLRSSGYAENTRIIYTSDHGDTLGEHGMWWKHTMYEGSAAVPLFVSGPGIEGNKIVETPVSHVDLFPTILETFGIEMNNAERSYPGTSLVKLSKSDPLANRYVFGEYHAGGSITGFFMIRNNKYKYVYYVGFKPQLFDLTNDPHELNDLSKLETYKNILFDFESSLRKIVDPEKVNEEAKIDQSRKIIDNGGKERILEKGYDVVFTPAPEEFRDETED